MIIDFIRHTTPDVASNICYGHADLDVAASFEQEANLVVQRLDCEYELTFTSPLQRCAKLAEKIPSKESKQDSRIMEYNFGDWEMKPWSEIKSDESDIWMKNFIDKPAPNGESMLIMQKRVMEFWHAIQELPFQKVAVVTHSGVLRLIHAHILETPLPLMFRLQLGYGAIIRTELHRDSGLVTLRHL